MSENPATNAVANKASKAAAATAAAVSDALPTVVETAEVALQVPSKVVMRQPLIVGISIVGGAALGVAGMIAYQRITDRIKTKKALKDISEANHVGDLDGVKQNLKADLNATSGKVDTEA